MKQEMRETVRDLRKHQTDSENIFWQMVRNRKMFGKKFLRQHPIQFEYMENPRVFIADFYCSEAKLVIEIDGIIHEKQKEYDELRTYIINQLGLKVLRIKNEEMENTSIIEKLLSNYL